VATLTATEIYSRYYTNGSSSCDFTAAKDGFYTIAGRGYYDSEYCNTVIKFVLDKPAKKLNFTLSHTNSEGYDTVLNYKLVSGADYSSTSSLNSATHTTSGDGTIAIDGGSGGWYDTVYSFDGSFSPGTWYLYLWSNTNSYSNWCRIRHTVDNPIRLTYEQGGVIRIGNGSTNAAHMVYIGDGSEDILYVAYVGNGSTWDLFSG